MNVKYAVYCDVIASNTFKYVPDEIINGRLVHYESNRLYRPLEHRTRITKHIPPLFDDLKGCIEWCKEADRQEKEYWSWDMFRREMFDYNIKSKHWGKCKELWDTKDEPFFMNWHGHVIYQITDNSEWRDIYTNEIIRSRPSRGRFTCYKCHKTYNHGNGKYGGVRKYRNQLRVYCKSCY